MFNTEYFRSLVIVALFMSLIYCLGATERTEYKRLMQYDYTYSHSMIGSGNGYEHYYYRVDNPSLIDTVGFLDNENGENVTMGRYQYYGNIQNTGEGKRIEYYINLIGQSYPYKHIFYVLDAEGRVTRDFSETWNVAAADYVNFNDTYRHFNAAGYADSVYYSYAYGTNVYHRYSKRSFDGTLLQNTVVYVNGPVNWIPSIKYAYTYTGNPVELPAFIRFDNLWSQSVDGRSHDIETFCNPKIVPESITRYNWESSAWVVDTNYTLAQSISNNQVSIGYVYNNEWSGSSEAYYANMEGDIVDRYTTSHGGEESGNRHEYFIWDSVVGNDDNLAPEPSNFITVYPNPFTNQVSIVIAGKDSTPADITIYNIKGQIVRQWQRTNATKLVWDGKDAANQRVSSGIYLIKSRQGKLSSTAKVIKL
ncbi:MAG: hypothetical protein CVU48_07595 [Candidatus Cloacimonetes bacterium HGW-Cloacimonetes-1]|jgi:hypothetical protein|nr:MAG: hypothetical protein CVU48_07595 [Candidatus Cloacimonetes bacterium HGW-Cloacimonetes-1]